MLIQYSILAGEILAILENVKGSVRVIDIEAILQTTKNDVYLAIAKLLSEGLIVLIKDDERSAITLTQSAEMPENYYLENNMAEF